MTFCGSAVAPKFVLQMNCFFMPPSARGLAHSLSWKPLCTEDNKIRTRSAQRTNTEKKILKNVQALKSI